MHALSHPPIGDPLSALLGLLTKYFGAQSLIVLRLEQGCRVVYQMGSYYSLWVTDPYDLEIGSTNATISIHTYTYTGAAEGEVHKRHGSCLGSKGSSVPAIRACERRETISDAPNYWLHSVVSCISFRMHALSHPPIGDPLSALLGLLTKYFGAQSLIVLRLEQGCRVVYQMGSYYSLWVTDPYDLEIGSTNATRFSCPRSRAR